MIMHARRITDNLLAALRDTPIVVLHGARQTGKSTLVQHLDERGHHATYVTLDNPLALAAAKSDPVGFLSEHDGPLIIDEVQRAPELILPMKAEVDRDRRPGRFLLTGSAHVMQIPKLADAFVGRMELLTLHPFSQGEIEGVREGFVDALFATAAPKSSGAAHAKVTRKSLLRRIVAGGYPEAVARKDPQRRRSWFDSYLNTVLMRDVRELSRIEGLSDLPRLLIAVAGRAGGLLNYAEIGRDTGMNQLTAKRYLSLLRATFLLHTLQPWFTNRIKRIVKSEKLYMGDTGILATVLDAGQERLESDAKSAGALLENFVALELRKQITWSTIRPTMWHFRDHQGHEVDFVLERPNSQKLVGIEVKWTKTLDRHDTRGLRVLEEAAGDAFHRGIVLYGGEEAQPIGRKIWALPVAALWQLGAHLEA